MIQSTFTKMCMSNGTYYCLAASELEKLIWLADQETPPEWMVFTPVDRTSEITVRTRDIIGFFLSSQSDRDVSREWEEEMNKEEDEDDSWKSNN